MDASEPGAGPTPGRPDDGLARRLDEVVRRGPITPDGARQRLAAAHGLADAPVGAPPAAVPSPSAPACPACGSAMVERQRRSDRSRFLGCSRYPACRGTRALPPAPPAFVRSDHPSAAGASAAAEYGRQLAAQQAAQAATLPERRRNAQRVSVALAVLGVVCLPLAVIEPAFAGAAAILLVGAFLAFALPLGTIGGRPRTSWTVGAAGEAATAQLLATLAGMGAVVLHDRRIPGGRANVDHIVVCPGGVFVVETKNYQGRVGSKDGVLTVNGYRRRAVGEARREAAAVSAALGSVPVTPLIVVHRASISVRSVGGVAVLGPSDLVGHILSAPVVLGPDDVARMGARVDRALRPAAQGR